MANTPLIFYPPGTGGGGAGSINVSAGTTSNNLTALTFDNAGGVSFGLNGSVITAVAPAAGGGLTNIKVSAGTLSANRSDITFANSNGISFGLETNGIITGTVATNYLTTARASNDGIGLNTAQTNVTWTVNSSGISINAGAYLTTAQPVGAYLTTARASNDAIGLNTAQTNVTWTVNSSGISLNAGAYLTTAALSNHSHNLATTTTNGSLIVVATTNSAGATFAVPPFLTTAQAPGAYLTTARASNDAVGLNTAQTNVTWTVNSSGISLNAGGYAGTGTSATNASVTLNSNGLQISVAAPGGGGNITMSGSNGSIVSNAFTFGNLNGLSFYTSNGSIVGSYTDAGAGGGISAVVISAGTTNNAISNMSFANANGVSFQINGSTISGSIANSSSIVGALGINVSTNGSTISIQNDLNSFFANVDYIQGSQTQTAGQSTSVIFPFVLANNFLVDHLQMFHTISLASTSFASTGNTSYSYNQAEQYNYVMYSRGTGANSKSLQSVYSTSAGLTFSIRCSQNTTNNISVTHGITYPIVGGTSTLSFSYAATNSTMQVSTTHMTALSGMKIWEIPFSTTVLENQYWFMIGTSTGQTTQQTANLSNARILHSHWAVSQPNVTMGSFGKANNASIQLLEGIGSFSTNAIQTTASLGFSNISSSSSHNMPLFTMMRI